MKLYAALSKVGFLRNHYARKFLFIAFLGIHIPLIGLLFFVLFYDYKISPTSMLLIALGMTLLATIITLMLLKRLISPIETASKALENYKTSRIIPSLSTEYTDTAGLLMANIQATVKINESLLQQKQDLAGLLSNDMKVFAETPLTAARKIIAAQPSPNIVSEANAIIESAERQKDFLETYINILQQEEALSKKVFKVRSIKFDEILNSLKRNFAEKLREKQIDLVTDVKIKDTYLRIDNESLLMVLTNLVDNAIKFSPAGGTVTITIYRQHSHVKIAVADNGAGFEGTSGNDLFKLTNMTRSAKEGKSNGMSLYLSSQIIKKSDGVFYAESGGDQKGATFFVDLKLYRKK
jgi:signal transduction histidine kinase